MSSVPSPGSSRTPRGDPWGTAPGGALPWVLIALSPLAAGAGFALGGRFSLPILCAAPAYVAMVILLARERPRSAIAAMLVWAALLGGSMTVLSTLWPERASAAIINGPAYWDEMKIWLDTGVGRESTPAQFLPQHLLHAGLFALLAIATGSALAILFGAVLMNYMAYYVGEVIRLSPEHSWLAGILAWHPWSVIRVAAYVVLGVCLAEPLLSRLRGRPRRLGTLRGWIAAAFAGLVLDAALKALLAPHWHALLRSLQ